MVNPKLFIRSSFRTQDVGRKGRLQRIAARLKSTGEWKTQAFRINLGDYDNLSEVVDEISHMRISVNKKEKAISLVRRWFNE